VQRNEEIRKSGHAGFAEKQQKLRDEKLEFTSKIAKVQSQLPTSEGKLRDAKASFEKCQSDLREIQNEQQLIQTQVTQCRNTLSAAQREQASQSKAMLNRYGQNLQVVLDLIENTRWAGEKPIGPLGMHVKIQRGQEQYVPVIESLLGIQLVSWAVTTAEDRRTLMKIFQDCVHDPRIET
jgi:chromosome segregation ATPase